MEQEAQLRDAFRGDIRQDRPASTRAEKRGKRADRTRAEALSPVRILLRVIFLPVAVFALTVSIYIRTSPFPRDVALAHLVSMTGCESAALVGLAPSSVGEPGYHARNDRDGDGIACDTFSTAAAPGRETSATGSAETDTARRAGGAKFLRP